MTLREMWLRPEQPDLAPIVEEIRTRCAEEGHTPPAVALPFNLRRDAFGDNFCP